MQALGFFFLIFLKLGGSAITDKTQPAAPKPEVIRELARAVFDARAKNPTLAILLGHGSGSFGHFTAKKFGYAQPDNWRAYAETSASAARLNRLVTDIFLQQAVPVVSFQPSASARTRDGELIHLDYANIRLALAHRLVPLIYGDVAFDETRARSIISTDAQFAFLAPILQPTRLVYTTAVGGIYRADPMQQPDAELIREITPATWAAQRAQVGASHGYDVTGGMMDKLARSVALVQRFPQLHIHILAASAAQLAPALAGEPIPFGTHIHA